MFPVIGHQRQIVQQTGAGDNGASQTLISHPYGRRFFVSPPAACPTQGISAGQGLWVSPEQHQETTDGCPIDFAGFLKVIKERPRPVFKCSCCQTPMIILGFRYPALEPGKLPLWQRLTVTSIWRLKTL
jgi:hypothetical protein